MDEFVSGRGLKVYVRNPKSRMEVDQALKRLARYMNVLDYLEWKNHPHPVKSVQRYIDSKENDNLLRR